MFNVDYYLVCEELNTNCFNSHFHAHEVSHDRNPFVKQSDLVDHSVLGLYKADTCFVVSTLSCKIINSIFFFFLWCTSFNKDVNILTMWLT